MRRRGERRLVLDIRYTENGIRKRFRKDAEVQTRAAALAEERRRLVLLAATGLPFERELERDTARLSEPSATGTSPKPTATFEAVVKSYLETYAPSELKPSTLFSYRAVLDGFLLPRLRDRRVDAIDATTVREFDTELVERGVKPATRRNVQTVLRSVLCRYAVEAKILSRAPELPRMPKVGAKVARWMSDEELEQILAAATDIHRRAFTLAAFAGLRAGELRALRWRDVNLAEGYLVVRESFCRGTFAAPKSGHERVIPLAPRLVTELEKVERRPADGLVTSNPEGEPWNEWTLLAAFRRTLKRAGVAGRLRLHDTRHYFVSSLFRTGTPAPAVQMLAGHASLSTTQLYAHVGSVDLKAAVSRLGASSGQHRGNGARSSRKKSS